MTKYKKYQNFPSRSIEGETCIPKKFFTYPSFHDKFSSGIPDVNWILVESIFKLSLVIIIQIYYMNIYILIDDSTSNNNYRWRRNKSCFSYLHQEVKSSYKLKRFILEYSSDTYLGGNRNSTQDSMCSHWSSLLLLY